MRLYIVRHGEPDYATDSLTERGRCEAAALGNWFVAEKIDTIYCSPLGRARQTAEIATKSIGKSFAIEPWTRELDYFRIENTELAAWNVPGEKVRQDAYLKNPANWESIPVLDITKMRSEYARVAAASDDFLARNGYHRNPDGYYEVKNRNKNRIAIVCHGGFGVTWLSHLLDIPLPLMWAGFLMQTTAITTVLMQEITPGIASPRCIQFGALPHLYASQLPASSAGFVSDPD